MGEIAYTSTEIDEFKQLLGKKLPAYRKAYSDRTAWLMACMSELAYRKFNKAMNSSFEKKIAELISSEKVSSLVLAYINKHIYDHEEEKRILQEELGTFSLRLAKTFSVDGTEAILVHSQSEDFLILAFRGTEADSFTDIKTDLNAQTTTCESGGRAHAGFLEAYDKVAAAIKAEIDKDEYKDMPLYITGHSLGGALATIATKKITHDAGTSGIAACYTFGSPLVGNENWIATIKSPIYRVVNAADAVTVLPPAAGFWVVIKYMLDRIPVIGGAIRNMLNSYSGYIHCGDMRYLTNCENDFKKLKLLYSVGIFSRLHRVIFTYAKAFTCKKFLMDHSISIYRNKLFVIAKQRNNLP